MKYQTIIYTTITTILTAVRKDRDRLYFLVFILQNYNNYICSKWKCQAKCMCKRSGPNKFGAPTLPNHTHTVCLSIINNTNITYLQQRNICLAGMVTELEQQKEKLLYDINNIADSVLNENYINPYDIER